MMPREIRFLGIVEFHALSSREVIVLRLKLLSDNEH